MTRSKVSLTRSPPFLADCSCAKSELALKQKISAKAALRGIMRRRSGLLRRQLDTRREIEHQGGASNHERARDRCATTAGGPFHRAAGDEIHAGNSRSNRVAAVRTASVEAALRFRYRQTRPFFSAD